MTASIHLDDYRSSPQPAARELPRNVEAEQAVLGAILVNNAAFHAIGPNLEAAHFSEELHKRIFDVAATLIRDGKIATPVTLKTFLGDQDLGGMTVGQYIARLCAEATTVINAPDYARQVINLAARRAIITSVQQAVEEAFDTPVAWPVERVIDGAEERLMAVRTEFLTGAVSTRVSAADAASGLLARVNRIIDRTESDTGISTGIPSLDEDTGGFRPGALWVIGGRPAMGKSMIGGSLALKAARDAGVLMFPFEIGRDQAAARFLSDIGYSGRHVVGYGDIMRGKIEPEDVWRLEDCEKQLRSMPLVMDDSSGATLAQISARVRSERDRMAKAGTKLGLVVWDYLKFIKASDRYSGQRHYEVGEISVGLKRICLDFGVCGLLMAQLNRQTEGRDDKRPQLADLRESGDLEADADVVAFVYREAYYADRAAGAKNGDPDLIRQAVDAQNKLELIVAKNRTGATRTHHLWCDIRCSKISAHTHGEG